MVYPECPATWNVVGVHMDDRMSYGPDSPKTTTRFGWNYSRVDGQRVASDVSVFCPYGTTGTNYCEIKAADSVRGQIMRGRRSGVTRIFIAGRDG